MDFIKLYENKKYQQQKFTKDLYPAVANKFISSPTRVERSIRHAILVAWSRGQMETINKIHHHNQ